MAHFLCGPPEAKQPEVRLADVALPVLALPRCELPGLAKLDPHLCKELVGGDAPGVVLPQRVVVHGCCDIEGAIPVFGVRVGIFCQGGNVKLRPERVAGRPSATTRDRIETPTVPSASADPCNQNPAAGAFDRDWPSEAEDSEREGDERGIECHIDALGVNELSKFDSAAKASVQCTTRASFEPLGKEVMVKIKSSAQKKKNGPRQHRGYAEIFEHRGGRDEVAMELRVLEFIRFDHEGIDLVRDDPGAYRDFRTSQAARRDVVQAPLRPTMCLRRHVAQTHLAQQWLCAPVVHRYGLRRQLA
ncbi:hypothetical protein C8F04DRAFT_1187948 [Mycena alexandri]|uniref:Uncharacterized protein n=1 Tax=Mycena alexandri TaxID=1745969 RepID=A0AAD6WYB3_9AGAR|nr:hypothetical protein C8F04DRAFT_1187948 [Mycena alexandri]